MSPTAVFQQVPAPRGSLALSALVALLPLVTIFVLLGVLKWKAHFAALGSLAVAIVVASVFGMSPGLALLSATEGAVFGLFPIMWIVFTAIWLYQVTVVSRPLEDLRGAFDLISDDPRVQAIIIAFCFGGLLGALAGFGAPVAITGVMLMALGFSPVGGRDRRTAGQHRTRGLRRDRPPDHHRGHSHRHPLRRDRRLRWPAEPPCWPASSRCCWSSSSTAGVAYARPGQWLCRSASPSRSPSSPQPRGRRELGRASECVERRLLHDAQSTSAESTPGCSSRFGEPVLVPARRVDGLFRSRLRAGNVGSCRPHSTSARS